MVYLAGSLSLAALEVLANLDDTALLCGYASIQVTFDSRLSKEWGIDSLPRDWNDIPPATSTRTFGTAWVNSAVSCLLSVPSAIIPGESNYLLNPLHPDIRKVQIGRPNEFEWDRRLSRK